ncbi:MAG: GNAT family N-acetyltransferase [Acidimicrobiia bacterium]|nr:GNAT family N-acetyltransferase [Acidimicrobiia bacterium]
MKDWHMGVTVRSPNAEDAERMGEVHVAAWRMAYTGVMPADYLAALDERRSAERWARNITNPTSGVTNLVAEVDGTIQAIATVGPFRDHKSIDDPSGELWMINVHPDAVSTGIATALHRRALDQLRSDGHHRAALWVVDDNPRARRFYEREGWSEDPVRKEDQFGDRTIAEVRYSISL